MGVAASPPSFLEAPSPAAVVLVEPSIRREARHALEGFGLRIELLQDAGIFVARIESERPDIVVFDLDVAGMSLSLVSFTRSLWPSSSLLAVANYWSERADDLREQVDGVLYKPVRPPQWHDELAKHLLRVTRSERPNRPLAG